MTHPLPSTHPKIQEWVPQLISIVPQETMKRFQEETCVNQDLTYKRPQVLSAASNDVPEGKVVERGHHVIDQCLLLRDALHLKSILQEDFFPKELVPMLEANSCLSVIGNDQKGNTVIYFNLTRFNPSEYAKLWAIGGMREIPESLKADLAEPCVSNYCSLWYVRMMTWIHAHRFESFKAGLVKEPRVVMILNVGSVGISTLSTELRQFLRGIKILGNYLFPEICDYIFAANVPWIADKVWPMIKMILHPATANKVDLYDHKRTKKFLAQLMHQDDLPKCFGGCFEPENKFKHHGRSPVAVEVVENKCTILESFEDGETNNRQSA